MKRRSFLKLMGRAAAVSPFVPITARLLDGQDLATWREAPLTATEALTRLQDHKNDLTALVHEVYKGAIVGHVRAFSPTAQMFSAGSGDYRLEGENLMFSRDLSYSP